MGSETWSGAVPRPPMPVSWEETTAIYLESMTMWNRPLITFKRTKCTERRHVKAIGVMLVLLGLLRPSPLDRPESMVQLRLQRTWQISHLPFKPWPENKLATKTDSPGGTMDLLASMIAGHGHTKKTQLCSQAKKWTMRSVQIGHFSIACRQSNRNIITNTCLETAENYLGKTANFNLDTLAIYIEREEELNREILSLMCGGVAEKLSVGILAGVFIVLAFKSCRKPRGTLSTKPIAERAS